MRPSVDTADGHAITQAATTGFVFGVTTSPTRLRRASLRRTDLAPLVQTAAHAGLREIHLQVFSADAAAMVVDARMLYALDPRHVVVKIPATAAGFRAAHELREEMPITITAVFTARQALLAGIVGARYAAVYLGRLHDSGQDAIAVLQGMLAAVRAQQMDVRLLVASVRAVMEVEMLAQLGIPAATLPPAILFALPDSAGTAQALDAFREDTGHL